MKKYTRPSRKIPTLRDTLGIHTLPELIEYSTDKYGDNVAYRTPRGNAIYELTYGRVLDCVRKFARHLKELGIEPGDHVALLGENRPEWGISLFALSWIGAVAIPLDARAALDSHNFILSFSAAKAVIVSAAFMNDILSIAPGLSRLRNVIPMDNIEDVCRGYATGQAMENIVSNQS
jgi:long-subunit acyl-CoA synthetase (AMP-forming)